MFPTLGLFASTRCPELTSEAGARVCRRNPCLFSHTAPLPARSFSITKRPTAPARAGSTPSEKEDEDDKRPTKIRKNANNVDTKSSSTSAMPVASTSRIAPLPKVASSNSTLRKSGVTITGSGKVVRSAAPAVPKALKSSLNSTSNASYSDKGKARAQDVSPSFSSTLNASSSMNSTISGPPRLPVSVRSSYFPIASRNSMIKTIFTEFSRIYANIQPRTLQQKLATQHTIQQEQLIYDKNNKFSYRNACVSVIARLKKRPAATAQEEMGTMEDYDKYLKEQEKQEKSRLTLEKADLLTMDRKALIAYDYVVDLPEDTGGLIPTEEGGTKKCERCKTEYVVHGAMNENELIACRHHWGRLEYGNKADKTRKWTCCGLALGSAGCSTGPHVFLEKSTEDLHSRVAFLRTESLSSHRGFTALDVVALDCELVYTTAGMSIARLTIVNTDAETVLDEFIKPNGMIVDLVTRWSGVTESDLSKTTRTLDQLRQEELGKYISEDTIIIGHGLENDLKALRLVHPAGKVIDTAQLYPHARGLPYRNSLRNLARDHLKIFIQDKGVEGHSSAVDAKAALDLVKLKAQKVEEGVALPNKGGKSGKGINKKKLDSDSEKDGEGEPYSLFTNGY